MKVAVVGSRNFTDSSLVSEVLSELALDCYIDAIVSGGAIGADSIGRDWAMDTGMVLIEHIPDRARLGWPRAAFERNTLIADECDILLAFFGPGEPPMRGDRKFGSGTMDTVQKAMRMRKPVHIYFQKED